MIPLKFDVLENIRDILNTVEKASGFHSIANFILENQNNSEVWNKKLSIFQLANLTNTSGSTITRFCQKIGLTGFKELHLIMKLNIEFQLNSFQNYNSHCLDTYIQYLKETISKNKIENLTVFHAIHNEIFNKKRIFFFSLYETSHLIYSIIPLLEHAGFDVFFTSSYEQQKFYASKLLPNDLVILVSLRLKKDLFDFVFKRVKELDLPIIVLTKSWFYNELNILKRKYVLKITNINDNFAKVDSNEIIIIFLLKLVFVSLLNEQNSKELNYSI